MIPLNSKYAQYYSVEVLKQTIPRAFSKAGADVVVRALQLYYLAKSPDLPLWAKTGIFAALGYFVVTPDAIPDITPIIGFMDDLAVLSSALGGLAVYLSPEIKQKAKDRLQRLLREQNVEPESKT